MITIIGGQSKNVRRAFHVLKAGKYRHIDADEANSASFHPEVGGGSHHGTTKPSERRSPKENIEKPEGPRIIRGGKIIEHACGLSVKIIDADPAHPYGVRWRARLGDTGREKGKILLNRSHSDWVESEAKSDNALHTYLTLMVLMVLSLPWSSTPDRAQIFREEFEENFLRFRAPLVPRIPSYGKRK